MATNDRFTMPRFLKAINFLVLFSVLLFNFTTVSAVGLKDGFSTSNQSDLNSFAGSANYSAPRTPEYYVGLALNGLFSILGVVAIAMILYSGYVWMTARGNDAKVTKAKDNLTEAIIGLLFIIGAYALTTFIFNIFI